MFAVVPLQRGIDGHRSERVCDEASLRPCLEFFEPLILGKSPLMAAVEQKRLKVVRYLVENKADVNFINPRSGEGVLWECQSAEMLKLLLSHKIDMNWRCATHKGTALLNFAQRRCRTKMEAEEIFLERATDANSKAQNTSEIRPGIRHSFRP